MKFRQTFIFKFSIVGVAITTSATIAQIADSTPELQRELAEAKGLCVQVGIDEATTPKLLDRRGLLVHCLDRRPLVVRKLQRRVQRNEPDSALIVELWTSRSLPHAENLANLILVNDPKAVDRSEIERVLRPGGVGLFRVDDGYSRLVKPTPSDTDDWTHQWHASGGGLTTEDHRVDVPRGIQWLSGPLFAMAGRKSSTQSLVSSGGVNFYVTQNVQENVGLPEMAQHLVARDAYNGLIIWQRRWTGPIVTGAGETNPRMVASPGKLYVTGEKGLLSLDPTTGETISEVELQRPADKILFHNNLVLVQFTNGITAFDSSLGSVQWEFQDNATTGSVVSGDGVYLLVSGRSADGRFRHDLICLDATTGSTRWRVNTQPHVEAARVRINFAEDGFVALQSHGYFHQFSAEDGRHLWTRTTKARPGKDYVDERYVGHFYRHGLVWMLKQNSPREPLGQNIWLGLDPVTGERKRELTTKGNWPRTETPAKMGCQLLIASDRFIMVPRQATFIDFESGEKLPFKFARGGCGLGFVPANGLVYSHPHACGCFSEAIRGFMGMHSKPYEELLSQETTSPRLQSIFAPRLEPPTNELHDWPIYRGSGDRSGFSQAELSSKLERTWSVPIATLSNTVSERAWKLRTGNVLTAPTIVRNTAFVADADAGRLHALDVSTGETKWTFLANGRIDSPPTLYRGLCLFGSHDGYVYCLETKSGQLAWRFRAAPIERRIVAFGNLESAWPVAGSVLVRDGIVYAAAGRAPDADGGIEVHALDAGAGKPIWSSRIEGGNFRGLCDYLVDSHDAIYLANWRINPKTGEHRQAAATSQHLNGGKAGLLEASWTKHDLALRKDIQTWTKRESAGQLLAFSPSVQASYQAEARRVLIVDDEHEHLAVEPPEQVTGLAITSNFVVFAGGADRSNALNGGFLRLFDIDSGEVEIAMDLSAEPVFDGVALAGRRIFVSTQDSWLHCFRAEQL